MILYDIDLTNEYILAESKHESIDGERRLC
jgi:hypothetical protein